MKKAVFTDNAPKAEAILSQAIISNGLIFVAGQIHSTPTGELVGGSTADKLRQVMANIEAILGAAEARLDDIVKLTIYVTDMSIMPELNAAYPEYFTAPLPAREAVCVKALPLGAVVEISVIAAGR